MDPDAEGLASHASHYWERKIAEEELTCWGNGTTINIGDVYYEYIMEFQLYGTEIEMPSPTVTEKEYFKHVLQGRPGFKYYDKT